MDDSIKQKSKRQRLISSSWILVIALIALLLAIISLWKTDHLLHSVATLNTETSTPLKEQADQVKMLKQSIADMQDTQIQLQTKYQQDLNRLVKTTSNYPNSIALTNATLLLNLANDRLQVDYDIPAAIHLLNAANTALSNTNTPEANLIKQNITKNIALLGKLPPIDTQTVYLKLAGISAELSSLSLATPKQLVTPSQNNKQQLSHTWRDRLRLSWESLKSLIIIRHDNQTTPELLSTTQQSNLIQNSQLLMMQTQFAVLKHDDIIYHHNLTQLITWLEKYFDLNNEKTKQIIQSLQDLNKININPMIPDVTELVQPVFTMNKG